MLGCCFRSGALTYACSKPSDVVVRQHDYAAGGSTGWHAHAYPVFVTVTLGQITFYEYYDPSCTPVVVSSGEDTSTPATGTLGGTRRISRPPTSA